MADENQVLPPVAPTPQETPISLGRVVLYYAHVNDGIIPHVAHVVHVWGTNCVNLDVIDGNGSHYTAYSVTKGGPSQPGTWAFPPRV